MAVLISSFKYGASVSNRSPVISAANLCSADKSLQQSGFCYNGNCFCYNGNLISIIASEVWCLGRFLPLLIGDLVPEDDEI